MFLKTCCLEYINSIQLSSLTHQKATTKLYTWAQYESILLLQYANSLNLFNKPRFFFVKIILLSVVLADRDAASTPDKTNRDEATSTPKPERAEWKCPKSPRQVQVPVHVVVPNSPAVMSVSIDSPCTPNNNASSTRTRTPNSGSESKARPNWTAGPYHPPGRRSTTEAPSAPNTPQSAEKPRDWIVMTHINGFVVFMARRRCACIRGHVACT